VPDHSKPLLEGDVDPDPLRQLAIWSREAAEAGVREPEAAALATSTAAAVPSVRMVLVKSLDDRGFVFFTNYSSRKGRELAETPHGALLFHWDPLGRQVRVEGPVQRVGAGETEAYVRSRPRKSQLSALASSQSRPVAGREELEQRVAELERRYPSGELPLPEGWGGFRLYAESIELWQQRNDRLHDRLNYRRDGAGSWTIERLSP